MHFVAPDVGTSAALWAAANDPALVRSLAIGGGAMAVPLQVGGTLKDIIEAPDMDGYRQIDSRDILGPVYDAMPGGAPSPDVRDDYLESYAGDRFVESARYVRTLSDRAAQAGREAARHRDARSRSSADAMTPWFRRPTKSSSTPGCPTAGWTFCPQGISHGKKCPTYTGTSSSTG